jgi:eukaryotic-like serine/threonine-protein kinase
MALLTEGQRIRDTYEVERFLGQGAFAEVYRVRHRILGRQALKVIKTPGLTVKETEEMLGEAILLSQIAHPNIVRVFDANLTETTQGKRAFFTMEYAAGGTLEHFWKSNGATLMPVATAVDLIRQVCVGLSRAHSEEHPIIHRDVKPQNVLVGCDATGLRARLSDFGLARRVNPLTFLATARGTRMFKAPEALRDLQADSLAGDVWAVGTTLYLLLTDRLPYAESALDELGIDAFEQPMLPPSRLNPTVDPLLDDVVIRALSVDAKTRYPTATELLAGLQRWTPRSAAASTRARSETPKSALGTAVPPDEGEARRMAAQAREMGRGGRLNDAADLLEEACTRWPELRTEYEYELRLWRRGLVM